MRTTTRTILKSLLATIFISSLMPPRAQANDQQTIVEQSAPKPISKSNSQETARQKARALNTTLGDCRCKLDADTRAAGEKPLGRLKTKDFRGKSLELTVVNDEYALKLFQQLTSRADIPFGFPEDGCYARAHEMSFQLEKKRVLTAKVFAHGSFRVANDKAENGGVVWGFHVAPVIVVDDGKERTLWVFDPSMFYEPVTLENWLASLTEHPKSRLKSVYLTSRFTYHYQRKEKTLTDYDPEDLRAARKIMRRYLDSEKSRTKKQSPDL